MHSIEVVTTIRNVGLTVTRESANSIAASCLRICGVPDVTIASAATTAAGLLAEFQHEIPSTGRDLNS